MLAIIEILFSRDPSKNHSYVTLGQFLTLQTYLVPIERDCKHIWSQSFLSLQAYLVGYKKILQPYVVHPYTWLAWVGLTWHEISNSFLLLFKSKFVWILSHHNSKMSHRNSIFFQFHNFIFIRWYMHNMFH